MRKPEKDERVGLVCVVPEPHDRDLLRLMGRAVAIVGADGTVAFASVRLVACVDDFGIDFDPKRKKRKA